VNAAKELDRASREFSPGRERAYDRDRGTHAREEAERRFIRQFRNTERLALDVDRGLSSPTARGVFTNQISPGLAAIRADLPTLAAYRGSEGRREDARESRHEASRERDRQEDRHRDRDSDDQE